MLKNALAVLAKPAMVVGVIAAVALPAIAASAATGAAGIGCTPGSGAKLAGKHITADIVSAHSNAFRCANLTGADLSGLSLTDADFTGANLTNANLQGADLTQANLTGAILRGAKLQNDGMIQATISDADFTGANLTDAKLGQATAHGTIFVKANLSGVNFGQAEMQGAKLTGATLNGADFTQADLTGANLSGADVSGATFTQATLTNTNFKGATGLLPWSTYVLIGAVVIFVLLMLRTLVQAVGARSGRQSAFSNSVITRKRPGIIRSVLGAILVAVGFHGFIGGTLGAIVSAEGPPQSQCARPACCARPAWRAASSASSPAWSW